MDSAARSGGVARTTAVAEAARPQGGVGRTGKILTMPSEPYFLRSERLGFRWWTENDLPLARRLWGDSEVTKFFGGPFAEEEIERRLRVELERGAAHGFQYWPMHLLAGERFVGCCGLRPYRLERKIPELG